MAWLSGLAGKAETLLNKIDQNTAAVLSKDKMEIEAQSGLTEVTWVPSRPTSPMSSATSPQRASIPKIISMPNLSSLTPSKSKVHEDESLMTYLDSPSKTPVKMHRVDPAGTSATPLSICVEPSTDNTDSISGMSIRTGQISPVLSHTSTDVLEKDFVDVDDDVDLKTQNLILRNEIEVLSNEMNILTHRAEASEYECSELRHSLTMLQQDRERKFNGEESEREVLVKYPKDSDLRNHLRSAQKNLEEKDELLDKQQTDHQKEINLLKGILASLESEKADIAKTLAETQATVERNRSELTSTRSELEQRRARALKTLQEKEKLIVELRGNATTGLDDATLMELNQLRQEREALREENQQICDQLRLARDELINADAKLERNRQEAALAAMQAQEAIALEKNRRLAVEEDLRHHSEEIRSVNDELSRQRTTLAKKLQKQESEISRLRSQLSAASTPSSEVESRLSILTQTLVLKQQALESLTTERNALRLQLEKIENQHRDMIGNMKKNVGFEHINDTDDAKAQVPNFLLETPFDTGVARRVKRAYSSLDAVSVRTGVFLRRYPLARILVLVYMIILHFWVLVVLFSYSPEAH